NVDNALSASSILTRFPSECVLVVSVREGGPSSGDCSTGHTRLKKVKNFVSHQHYKEAFFRGIRRFGNGVTGMRRIRFPPNGLILKPFVRSSRLIATLAVRLDYKNKENVCRGTAKTRYPFRYEKPTRL
ncbi:hypothetical protein BIW11_10170, partial [Tropilaelaps mercedesae]